MPSLFKIPGKPVEDSAWNDSYGRKWTDSNQFAPEAEVQDELKR